MVPLAPEHSYCVVNKDKEGAIEALLFKCKPSLTHILAIDTVDGDVFPWR